RRESNAAFYAERFSRRQPLRYTLTHSRCALRAAKTIPKWTAAAPRRHSHSAPFSFTIFLTTKFAASPARVRTWKTETKTVRTKISGASSRPRRNAQGRRHHGRHH